MFAKLLKYDLKSVLRYWWVAAVSSAGLTVLACICGKIVDVEYTALELFQTLASIAMVFFILGVFLFPVLNTVLVYMRFYKNFFTDEGYLTFTLPVTTAELLTSKILCSFIFGAATALTLCFDAFLAMAITVPEELFDLRNWQEIFEELGKLIQEYIGIGWFTAYSLESLILIILSSLTVSIGFMLCLTLAYTHAKKHRVLAAIAIYYAASIALSIFSSFLTLEGTLFEIIERFMNVSDTLLKLNLSMILLIIIGLVALAATVLYFLLHRLLEKKLNLD